MHVYSPPAETVAAAAAPLTVNWTVCPATAVGFDGAIDIDGLCADCRAPNRTNAAATAAGRSVGWNLGRCMVTPRETTVLDAVIESGVERHVGMAFPVLDVERIADARRVVSFARQPARRLLE